VEAGALVYVAYLGELLYTIVVFFYKWLVIIVGWSVIFFSRLLPRYLGFTVK